MIATPYVLSAVTVPGGGWIGLGACPGRRGTLSADLEAIAASSAKMLITLVESDEFSRLGVPEFALAAAARGFVWRHVPIPDFGVPDADTLSAWTRIAPEVAAILDRGERVAIHCAAGLGRSGMIAAKWLVDRGVAPETAIATVRRARPGAIETAAQVQFVHTGPRLLPERAS